MSTRVEALTAKDMMKFVFDACSKPLASSSEAWATESDSRTQLVNDRFPVRISRRLIQRA